MRLGHGVWRYEDMEGRHKENLIVLLMEII